MDKLAKEFKDRLDQGIEYHHTTEENDWIVAKVDDTGLYYVQKDAALPCYFKRVDQAVYSFLAEIGWWE